MEKKNWRKQSMETRRQYTMKQKKWITRLKKPDSYSQQMLKSILIDSSKVQNQFLIDSNNFQTTIALLWSIS